MLEVPVDGGVAVISSEGRLVVDVLLVGGAEVSGVSVVVVEREEWPSLVSLVSSLTVGGEPSSVRTPMFSNVVILVRRSKVLWLVHVHACERGKENAIPRLQRLIEWSRLLFV